jgi:hypothetical protein
MLAFTLQRKGNLPREGEGGLSRNELTMERGKFTAPAQRACCERKTRVEFMEVILPYSQAKLMSMNSTFYGFLHCTYCTTSPVNIPSCEGTDRRREEKEGKDEGRKGGGRNRGMG